MQVETCNNCPSMQGLGQSGWWDWFRDVTTGWSKTGQQILISQNPTPIYTTGPGGTTIYQPTQPGAVGPIGGQRSVTPVESVAGTISSTTILVIGAVVIVALLMSKGD